MGRIVNIILFVLAGSILALTVPIGGRTLIGIDYRAVVNTEYTVCPDWVVHQHGNIITLSTNEQFRVRDMSPEDLTAKLLEANAYVKVDRVHNALAVRRYGSACGLRPEQHQWLTIPLHATEHVQTYYAEDIGDLEPVDTTTDK